jgi:hypothetical protein
MGNSNSWQGWPRGDGAGDRDMVDNADDAISPRGADFTFPGFRVGGSDAMVSWVCKRWCAVASSTYSRSFSSARYARLYAILAHFQEFLFLPRPDVKRLLLISPFQTPLVAGLHPCSHSHFHLS